MNLLHSLCFLSIAFFLSGCAQTDTVKSGGAKVQGLNTHDRPTVTISTSTETSRYPDIRYLTAVIDKENRTVRRYLVTTNLDPSGPIHSWSIRFVDRNRRKVTLKRTNHKSDIHRSSTTGQNFKVTNYFALSENNFREIFYGNSEFRTIFISNGQWYRDRSGANKHTSSWVSVKFSLKDARTLEKALANVLEQLSN